MYREWWGVTQSNLIDSNQLTYFKDLKACYVQHSYEELTRDGRVQGFIDSAHQPFKHAVICGFGQSTNSIGHLLWHKSPNTLTARWNYTAAKPIHHYSDQTDLFNCLSFDNILIAHFHSGVKQSLYEVSWTDPHEIGGFVCTWVTKLQHLEPSTKTLNRIQWHCLRQNPSYFQCRPPRLAPLSAALWTSCYQSAW